MRRYPASILAAVSLSVVIALAGVGCSSDDNKSADTSATDTAGAASTTTGPDDATLQEGLTCDPLDERACLLRWPNDPFTRPDATTATGRRPDIHAESTPANAKPLACPTLIAVRTLV